MCVCVCVKNLVRKNRKDIENIFSKSLKLDSIAQTFETHFFRNSMHVSQEILGLRKNFQSMKRFKNTQIHSKQCQFQNIHTLYMYTLHVHFTCTLMVKLLFLKLFVSFCFEPFVKWLKFKLKTFRKISQLAFTRI